VPYRFLLDLSYWLGAPGVGTLLATCAPPACALANGAVSVIPDPETCAPAGAAAESVLADCNRKSSQLLSVSAPSGNRPALLLVPPAAAAAGPGPRPDPGEATRQPPCPAPEAAW
jgi:hypothetical protein